MGRPRVAPVDYCCPYRKACPELMGRPALEVRFAVSEYERLERQYGMLAYESDLTIRKMEAQLDEKQKRIDELQAQLVANHRRQFKAARRAEHTIKVPERFRTKKRRPGAPKGHPPWSRRKPDHIDSAVNVAAPQVCPHCATAGLAPSGQQHRQLQEDIVIEPRTKVTEYIHDLAYCPHCRRDVFQTAAGELRNCEIGPKTKAAAAFLRHEAKMSYRDVRKIFNTFFGMPFVPASAMAFDRTITKKGLSLYEDLKAKLKASDIVYGDETHWRIAGKAANTWYAGNEDIALYHVDRSRAGDVAVALLGDNFAGALGADAYAGYNAVHAKQRQSCLAHLTRRAKEIDDEIELLPEARKDEKTRHFLNAIRTMISYACQTGAARNAGMITQQQALRYIPRFQSLLKTICLHPVSYEKAEKFRQRLLDPQREWHRMFTFLEVPGMHPTNNHAEQALRLPVIFRKICFGNRSDEGAKSLGVILSLITTAKRQQRDPLAFLQTLIADGHEAAKPMHYRIPPDQTDSS
jgi:transposase